MKAVQGGGGMLFTKLEMLLSVFFMLFVGLGNWRGGNDYQRRIVHTMRVKLSQYFTSSRCDLEHR